MFSVILSVMSTDRTLARVDADLRAGHIPMARQRLRGLVASVPTDLEARRCLAAVYRLYGEPAEAGRWGCLDAACDPLELAAFEASRPDPVDRMRAIAWSGPESAAATPFAAGRLAELRTAASAAAGSPLTWEDLRSAPQAPEPSDDSSAFLGCAAFALFAALLFLTVLGAITFISWFL